MQYTIYVLKSFKDGKRYVGMTANLERRLKEHNSGTVFSTKGRRPFEVVYSEVASTRIEARNREKFLKSGSGREFLESLLKSETIGP